MYYRVPRDLRSVIYCTAIRQGGDREWEFLWAHYNKSNVGSEQLLILGSLGCSREVWLLQRYLDWSLDDSTGVSQLFRHRHLVFFSVAQTDIGFLVAKSSLLDQMEFAPKYVLEFGFVCNLAKINDIFPSKFFSLHPEETNINEYLEILASQMFFQKEYDEIENFVQKNSEILKGIESLAQQSLETISVNSGWHVNNYEKIGRLLTDYEY